MSDNILKERAERIENAFKLLQGNKDNLGNLPGIIRQLVTLRVWEGYEWKGKTIIFSSFREFVETPPPQGLGTTVDELITFCKKYPEVADLVDKTVQEQAPTYRHPEGDILSSSKESHGHIFSKIPSSFTKSGRKRRELRKSYVIEFLKVKSVQIMR